MMIHTIDELIDALCLQARSYPSADDLDSAMCLQVDTYPSFSLWWGIIYDNIFTLVDVLKSKSNVPSKYDLEIIRMASIQLQKMDKPNIYKYRLTEVLEIYRDRKV